MASPGPEVGRFYRDIASRLNTRLDNLHLSIRSLRHSIHDRITRLHPSTNNASNSIIVNINDDSSENFSNATTFEAPSASLPGPGNADAAAAAPSTPSGSPTTATTTTTTTECNGDASASTRPTSHRRARRSRSSQRHSYPSPHGLISIRTLEKDRNVLAAILSIVVIAILSTALAQFKWFSIYNDLCDSHFYSKSEVTEKDLSSADQILDQHPTLHPQPFINARSLHASYPSTSPVILYGYAPGYKLGCATPQIIALKRAIIGLCFLAIMSSSIQFFLDIIGAKRKWVNTMRTHAVGNIITVLLCVLIIGLCYFVSILYERAQLHYFFRKFRPAPVGVLGNKPFKPLPMDKTQYDFLTVHQVKFELSYYLVTLAGFLSILAAAANLFRNRPRQIFIERISSHSRHRNRLNGDESSLLASDLLNSDSPGYFPFYQPGGWMLNPNWNSHFYSLDHSNAGSSTPNRPTNMAFPPPTSTCPPPPYSP